MYTNKSIRLHARCLAYLELIQKCNNRLSSAATDLHHFDHGRDPYSFIRLFGRRDELEDNLTRWTELSEWLVTRYQTVMSELVTETLKRIPATLKVAV